MATMAGVSLSSIPRVVLAKQSSSDSPAGGLKAATVGMRSGGIRGRRMMGLRAAPEGLSEKIAESIEKAKQSCSEDPVSGECAALWDEVEELSAASSHARDKAKDSDPLETYCKDNPETDECRTYDD